jgi:hypothetical protein
MGSTRLEGIFLVRRTIVLALLIAVTACSSSHKLTECRGSFAAANPGKWQPNSEDLRK